MEQSKSREVTTTRIRVKSVNILLTYLAKRKAAHCDAFHRFR